MNITSAKYCPKTKFESESSHINATIDGNENIVPIDNNNIEEGECTVLYPKKILCKYYDIYNKILVSNGKSLIINSDKISLGDSEYIHIGIGSDLKIQHDSNNSIISNSTGELLIDSPIHNFRDTSNTSKAYIASDGKIKLGSGGAPVGAAKVEIRRHSG